MVRLNTLIQWNDKSLSSSKNKGPGLRIDRILKLYVPEKWAWVIDVYDPNAWPISVDLEEIELALLDGRASINQDDPHKYIKTRTESELDPDHRRDRDRLWVVFENHDEVADLFSSSGRGRFVKQSAIQLGLSEKQVRTYVRRFLQSGMVKNSLLPHSDKCGARGKKRSSEDGKRLGRLTNKEKKDGGVKTGTPITQEIEQCFEDGVKLFLRGNEPFKLTRIHQGILEKFFSEDMGDTAYGIPVRRIKQTDIPTLRQFRRWYYQKYSPEEVATHRHGQKSFRSNYRAKTGHTTDMAVQAGKVFLIDDTPGDIYVVAETNRNLVLGKPRYTYVVDVAEALIVGIDVSLGNSSYLSHMVALENAFTSKVEFCKRFGVPINDADWPYGICDYLIADKTPALLGDNGNNLANNLNIKIQTTASSRPDMKGQVEQVLNQVKDKVLSKLPGYAIKSDAKGTKNPAVNARLTIDELTHLFIVDALEWSYPELTDTQNVRGGQAAQKRRG